MGEVTFVIGGTRSGKSRFALARAKAFGGDQVTFVATARPGDPELDARIASHRAVRPPVWRTIEAAPDLSRSLAAAPPEGLILLDSLTLWVAWCLEQGVDVGAMWDRASAGLASRPASSIIVSDEVGLGIVPTTELGRRFRDQIGILHQRVAAEAAVVVFMVAGVPLCLKGDL